MSLCYLKYIMFVLACMLLSTLHAQDIPIVRYGKENGLASNTVYAVFRDSKGFLWFGTDRGVSRYNGIHFENFNTSDGLADNDILNFVEDRDGRLWMDTYNGKLCFYKNGKFHTAANTSFLQLPFKRALTRHIKLEEDGSISIGFGQQPIFINVYGERIKIFDLKSLNFHKRNEGILDITKIPGTGYEVVTQYRTFLIGTSGRVLRSGPNRIPDLIDKNGDQFLAADGIYSLNGKLLLSFAQSKNLKRYLNHKMATRKLYGMHRTGNTLFALTGDGIWLNDSLHLLNNMAVPMMVNDNAGNYWIPTTDGAYRISVDPFAIKQYNNRYTGKVAYAYADSTNVFFATEKGDLHRLNAGRVHVLSRYEPKAWHLPIPNQLSCTITKDSSYYSFFRNSNIVIRNIYSQHPLKQEYRVPFHYQWKNIFVKNKMLYALLFNHIKRVDYNRQKPGSDLHMDELPGNANDERMFTSTIDSAGSIWYSTITRVFRVVNDSAVSQPQFGHTTFKWMEICGNYLVGLTHEDNLLLCNNFADRNIDIDTITEKGVIWIKAYQLDDKHLLITTNNCYRIIVITPSPGKPAYSMVTVENSYIPGDAEYICGGGGNCWFFKNGTIHHIDIATLLKNNIPPRLVFTSLSTKVDTMFFDNTSPPRIAIPFSRSGNITISFAALSFNSSKITYEYCALSDDIPVRWVTVKNDGINLVSPDYGNYTVKVRARTLSGDYSLPVTMYLTILKPFWAELWFLALSILLVTIVIIFSVTVIVKYRLRQKEKKHATEITLMKSEYKALNALMNPHFIFNSLNSIQGLVNSDNKVGANEYLHYFSKLVRQNMHNVSQELISLEKELEIVTNYLRLEQIRFDGWLNYRIDMDEDIDADAILIPPLLIQPLVENALKHGLLPKQSAENMLVVRVYENDTAIFIEIEDNGIGFHRSPLEGTHQSIAISNLQKRIDYLNQIHSKDIRFNIKELINEQGIVKGTLVVLSVMSV
jgi:two-component sensor histidine kinase